MREGKILVSSHCTSICSAQVGWLGERRAAALAHRDETGTQGPLKDRGLWTEEAREDCAQSLAGCYAEAGPRRARSVERRLIGQIDGVPCFPEGIRKCPPVCAARLRVVHRLPYLGLLKPTQHAGVMLYALQAARKFAAQGPEEWGRGWQAWFSLSSPLPPGGLFTPHHSRNLAMASSMRSRAMTSMPWMGWRGALARGIMASLKPSLAASLRRS